MHTPRPRQPCTALCALFLAACLLLPAVPRALASDERTVARPLICEQAANATLGETAPVAVLKLWDACLAVGGLEDKDQAYAQCSRGDQLLRLKFTTLAEQAYDRCVALAPDQALARSRRAAFYYAQKKYTKALEEVQTGIRLDAKEASLRYVSASCWCALDACAKGLDDLDELVRLEPASAAAYHVRGWVYEQVGQREKSLADYHKALELNPRSVRMLNERALLLAGLGRHDQALADLNDAVRLDAKEYRSYSNRGVALYKLGRWSEAIDDYKTTLRLAPGDRCTQANLAWAYASCPDPALQNAEEALRLARKSWTGKEAAATLDTLAAAYARVGRFDEAVAAQAEVVARMIQEKAKPGALQEAQARLELYKSGQPFTENPVR